jgi:hypothetical protein
MPKKSIEERAFILALTPNLISTSLNGGPVPKPTNPKAALRRCCAAWQRSFDAQLESVKLPDSTDKMIAAIDAGEAYRNAMPMLAGYEGVRDFLACAAQGILIGAIKPEIGGQLLYAAQIALNTLPHEPRQPKQSKQPSGELSPQPPSQKALPSGSDFQASQMQ